jgi:cation transport regulator ChaB
MRMEAIKIPVEVSVNLSENTQNFIKSLFNGACQCTNQKGAPAVEEKKPAPAAPAVEEKKPAPAAPAVEEKKPAPAAPAVEEKKPAPAAPAVEEKKPASSSKTIEDVRAELAKKVNDHRSAIKDKLTELGAPSVTKLDPSKYDEMYNFLAAL